jgi:A/G-specific adenine glycosylase
MFGRPPMSRAKPVSPPRAAVAGGTDAQLRRALLDWFRKHRRPLPWRDSLDPYNIWVSEVMLQQTQVAAVIPYYRRFLSAFPTVHELARAPLERVLELWSGLGYYRRARQLHLAAQIIVKDFNGRFPSSPAQAMQLPGIGDYSAAAVLSIAYGTPLAALDGNVARVLARLEALAGSVADPAFRKVVQARLAGLLSRRRPGDFNQALMELGQTVCLPRTPRCPVCPLRSWCRGRARGNPERFPIARPRRAREESHLAAALVVRRGPGERGKPRGSANGTHFALLVRGLDDGLMTDLWNFPSAFGASIAEARLRLEAKLGSLGAAPTSLDLEVARVRHNVTYRQILVRVYRASLPGLTLAGVRWLPLSHFDDAAVSQLARKIANAAADALN